MRTNRHPIDDDSAARMLGGLVHPDDAPPGYSAVAALLTAAGRPAPVGEETAAVTVAAMVDAVREAAPAAPATSRRRAIIGKLLAGKALAVLGVVALTATGAAAATGSLPDPAQGAVASAASHVGVDLPHPARGNSAAHRQDGAHRPSGDQGQSADHRQDGDHGPSADDPAGDAPSGDHGHEPGEISDVAHQAKEDGQPVGPTVSGVASDGRSHAGEDHPAAEAGDGTDHESGDDNGVENPPTDVSNGHDSAGDHGRH